MAGWTTTRLSVSQGELAEALNAYVDALPDGFDIADKDNMRHVLLTYAKKRPIFTARTIQSEIDELPRGSELIGAYQHVLEMMKGQAAAKPAAGASAILKERDGTPAFDKEEELAIALLMFTKERKDGFAVVDIASVLARAKDIIEASAEDGAVKAAAWNAIEALAKSQKPASVRNLLGMADIGDNNGHGMVLAMRVLKTVLGEGQQRQ